MSSYRLLNIDFYMSDEFLSLSDSVKNLYTALILHADDYGIVATPKTVMRLCGANDEDITKLVTEKLLIEFDSGKVCIRHWNVHNHIQPSKLVICQNVPEIKQLLLVEDTREYLLKDDVEVENRRQTSAVFPPQYKTREGKVIQGKVIEENSTQENQKENNQTQENASQGAALADDEFQSTFERIREQKRGL